MPATNDGRSAVLVIVNVDVGTTGVEDEAVNVAAPLVADVTSTVLSRVAAAKLGSSVPVTVIVAVAPAASSGMPQGRVVQPAPDTVRPETAVSTTSLTSTAAASTAPSWSP